MASSTDDAANRLIVDSVHGDIHLTDREWRILDTLAFQRLRRLKQLQMGHVTYPNATHTRFAHSLGTLAIMKRILALAGNSGLRTLTKEDRENLQMAALLHDIGHYPYSHLMERLGDVTLTEEAVDDEAIRSIDAAKMHYPSHEEVGKEIVTNQQDLIEAIGGEKRAKQVADLFTRSSAADPQLSKLLHSSFDMDRADYLQRDARSAGVPYGDIDINYLLNSLRLSPTGMVGVAEKALPAAEQFLLARFFMHKAVYFHKTTHAIEEACRQLLRRLRDEGLLDMPRDKEGILEIARTPQLADFTDDYVDRAVHKAAEMEDTVIRALARCVETRRPPKLLKEVQVLEDASRQRHSPGQFFFAQAKRSLKALAEKHDIPLGRFMFCQTKPLKLEARGALLTTDEARDLQSEQEDELIKVFVGTDPEPKSLVDVRHSIIHVCGNHMWQAFRLYLVPDETDGDDLVEPLRQQVQDWDQPT